MEKKKKNQKKFEMPKDNIEKNQQNNMKIK